MRYLAGTIMLALFACSGGGDIPGHDELVRHVEGSRVGVDTDHWIVMRSTAGQWEKVGLIFGYNGDREECDKALDGLERANPGRAYYCVPAQAE